MERDGNKLFTKFKKFLVLAVFIAAALGILSFLKNAEKKKSAGGRNQKNGAAEVIVKTVPVIIDTVETIIDINGRLFSDLETTVSAEVDGVVESTAKEMGESISSGEMLVKIKDIEYEIKYRQANLDYMQALTKLSIETSSVNVNTVNIENISSVKKARANYENVKSSSWRIAELRKNDLTSKQLQDDIESKLKAAEADLQYARDDAKTQVLSLQGKNAALDLAKKKLADTRVLAPYAGIVQKRLVSAGEYVRVGTPLYSIIKNNPIKFIGGIPENYVSEIATGKSVEVTVDAAKGTFAGKITRISPSSTPENHSVDIEVSIENAGGVLKPGYFAESKIILDVNPGGIIIPTEALYIFAGVEKVFAVKDNVVQERKIKIGRRYVDRIEVKSGLKGDEMVAVSNISQLYEGVRIKKPEEAKQ